MDKPSKHALSDAEPPPLRIFILVCECVYLRCLVFPLCQSVKPAHETLCGTAYRMSSLLKKQT